MLAVGALDAAAAAAYGIGGGVLEPPGSAAVAAAAAVASSSAAEAARSGKRKAGEGGSGDDAQFDDDEDLVGLNEDDKRRIIRQKRNRLSAQLSRDRKKNYVSELEQKVQKRIGENAQLTACCKKLLQENRELRITVASFRDHDLNSLGQNGMPAAGMNGQQMNAAAAAAQAVTNMQVVNAINAIRGAMPTSMPETTAPAQ